MTRAESVRRGLAPLVALVASSVAVLCTASLVDVLDQLASLRSTNERFAGWFATGGLVTALTVLVAVVLARRTGSGPLLAIGTTAAVFGLAIGGPGVGDDAQLAFALLILGLAVGGLLGGGLCTTLELSRGLATVTLLAWGLPLVAGWPVQTWVALHHSSGEQLRLVTNPPVWVLAPLLILVVGWAIASMLLEPGVVAHDSSGWEDSWPGLLAVLALAYLLAMALGFDPEIRASWLRPLLLVLGGVAGLGWVLVTRLIAELRARLAYLCVSVVGWGLPTVTTLLVKVADDGSSRVGWLGAAALAGATGLGMLAGTRRPLGAAPVGLIVAAGAAAGAWVLPDQPWLMLAAGIPLSGAAGAVWSAGLTLAMSSPVAVRFVGLSAVGALVLGSLLALPVAWALVGDLPVSVDDTRAAGRVFLGIGFAVATLASAYGTVLAGRISRVRVSVQS